MRINARLDDSYEEKFLHVQNSEKKNRSEILKDALEQYFARKFNQEEKTILEKNQMLRQQLSGIVSDSAEGSVTYKQQVAKYLDEKYTDR